MVPPSPNGSLYKVTPSGLVLSELARVTKRARAAGQGDAVLHALKIMFRMLSVCPQAGMPLAQSVLPGTTSYVATFQPLVVEYLVNEPNHEVFIVVPIRVLPNAGFQ
jgi:hypothetical protein